MPTAPGEVRHSPTLTVEEATAVHPGPPLVCSDPILAGSINCAEWAQFPTWDPRLGHRDNRISQAVIENLYRSGYALVKVLPEDGE